MKGKKCSMPVFYGLAALLPRARSAYNDNVQCSVFESWKGLNGAVRPMKHTATRLAYE